MLIHCAYLDLLTYFRRFVRNVEIAWGGQVHTLVGRFGGENILIRIS